MRNLLLLVLLGGCGDDTTAAPNDLAVADVAVAGPDLSFPVCACLVQACGSLCQAGVSTLQCARCFHAAVQSPDMGCAGGPPEPPGVCASCYGMAECNGPW